MTRLLVVNSLRLLTLLQVGVLEVRGESIVLSPDFTRAAYESNHYQQLIKSAKPWRARLIGILKGD